MKIITQKRKRWLTLLMSLSLIFTSVIRVSAAPSTPLNFEEVDPKFLAQVKDNSNSLSSFTPDPDAVVRIMVELEDEPLVEKEEVLPNALTRGIQAPSSVNAHEQEILEAKQDTVLEKVQEIDPEAELIDQFTYLSNSISFESTAKNLDAFKSLDGVRRAFIEKEYTIPKPQMFTSNGLIRSNVVWNTLDIHGEGMTVAVLDTGLDTDHPAFNVDPANPKLNQDDIVTLMSGLDNNHVIKRRNINLEDLYLNPKVPYRFDYAEQRVSVKPTAENYSNIDHGTHVSGTVAGNDGHDFKGVAPEAQILSFKVFNDEGGGAYDSIIVAALEDAVRLEVDAINMSLGSDAGFTSDSSDFVNDVHERISKKGILVSASAGNATSSAHKNNYGTDLSLAIDPDHGIVGSPSTYNGPLSIASSENTEMITVSFEVDGEPIDFINTSHPITELAGQHDFVVVPNIGLPEDYEGIDVTGKIAFVQRGEIAFSEKINHAADKGAIGVVIFGTNEDRIQMQLENTKVPSAYITLSNYERIEATGLTTFIINDQEKAFSNPAAGQPSDFTSFGTTPHLNIKPEISAPGGQIYSTLPSQGPNNYGSMSGTSMAAPHVAGAAALVKQYLKQNNSLASDVQLRDLMDNLLMSTATINHDENGVPYPVRQQGSGNMDVYGALSSPAFLSVQPNLNDDGSTRPKLELKDDAEQSGIYHVEFDVTNISDKPQTYTISADLGTPGVVDVDYSGTENAALGVKTFMSDKNRRLETKVEGPKSVHINPGKTQSVSLTLSISDADKALMAEQFENGIYVEGFIVLSNETDAKASDLSIPLLAFFGSWEKAPIFDHTDIYSKDKVASNFHHLLVSGEWLLGSDFINTENIEVDPGRLVLSPNGDDQLDQLDFITVGQLRNAKDLLLTVTDKDGNELYSQTRNDAFKTYYNNKESRHVPYTSYPQGAFDPISFNDFEDGSYTLSVQADLGYTKGYDDEVSWTIHVDRVAPTITATQLIDDKLQITVSDTNFMSISGVYAIINGEPFFKSPLSTNYTPNDLIKEHTLEVDLELLRSIGIKQFYVTAVDAGMNESGFIFDVPEIETEPVDDIVVLTVDETYQIDTEGATYSSEDETIATVDEKGLITALSEGQTVVSAEVNGATTRTWVHVNAKEGFTFDETHYVLNVNETRNIGLTGNDEALDIDLFEFEISDDAIVSLEKSAITGLKLGKAVLTAVSKEDPTDFKKILIEVVDLDRQALTLAIKSTESLEETNYTAESWGPLNEAVSHAAQVLESAKTQDELDAATEALNAAIEALKVSIKNLNESYTLELGTVKRVSPTPTDGTWSYDESTVNVTKDINGYVIEPLVTGNVTLAYTTNEGVTQIITLTVTPKPVIEKPATGTDKPVGDPKDKETPSDQKPKPPVKTDEEGKAESNDSTLPTTGVGLDLTPAVLILSGTALIVAVYLKRKTSHSHSL